MTRLAARSTKILVLAGLALAVTASSGSAASAKRSSMLSAVRHARRPAARMTAAHHPAKLKFDASYESLINRYFTDVAHDSGLTSNVYSVATQYSDGTGPIEYQSTFGGSYVDHDPLPASGCKDGQHSPCLTDKQLQTEIQDVLKATGWHGGTGNLFFLMTPNGVDSCSDSFGAQCSSNYFCAYHSSFTDSNNEPVIYADEPYQASIPACDPGSSPNGDDADSTINTISHEQNEAITDPFDTPGGWYANDPPNYDEEADLCAWTFGTTQGSGSTEYNQVINGDHYWLQQEWSNAGDGCVQYLGGPSTPASSGSGPLIYHGGPVMHTNTTYAIYWLPVSSPAATKAPHISGSARIGRQLIASKGSWSGPPATYSFQWLRCNGSGGSCTPISHATHSTYRLRAQDAQHRLRVRVRARNSAGSKTATSGATRRVPAAKS